MAIVAEGERGAECTFEPTQEHEADRKLKALHQLDTPDTDIARTIH